MDRRTLLKGTATGLAAGLTAGAPVRRTLH